MTPALDNVGVLIGFAANRAHHADVGGRMPGSMPADSRSIEEEGVIISPRVLDDAAITEVTGPDAAAEPAPGRPAGSAGGQSGSALPARGTGRFSWTARF